MTNKEPVCSKAERAIEEVIASAQIERKEMKLAELSASTEDADYTIFREIGELSDHIETYQGVLDSLTNGKDLYNLVLQETEKDPELLAEVKRDLEEAIDNAETFILNQYFGEEERKGCSITIYSADKNKGDHNEFIRLLLTTYENYAKKNSLSAEVVEDNEDKKVLFLPTRNSYGFFQSEDGIHRFEFVKGKTYTNNILVEVNSLEEKEEPSKEEIISRFRYTFSGASSSGGQNANRNATGVRVVDPITEEQAVSKMKSRTQNIKLATEVLYGRVLRKTKTEEKPNPFTGIRFRNYDFASRHKINDYRAKVELSGPEIEDFFSGNIKPFTFGFYKSRQE